MRVEYQIKGLDSLERTVRGAIKNFSDFKVPLERCGIEMYKSIDKNFQGGGRPRWAGHAPLTKKLRPGGKILMDSGKLRQSVTAKGSAGSKYRLSKDQLVIGSNLKARGSSKLLAEIHQLGQPAGVHKVFGKPSKRGMPARPFLLIQDEDANLFEKIFSDYIEETLR